MFTLRLCRACVLATSFVTIESALAITTRWNSNLNGSFTNAARWTDGVPTSADIAIFDRNLNVQYGVTFPGRPILMPLVQQAKQLKVGTNSVIFSSEPLDFDELPSALKIDAGNTLLEDALIIGDTVGQVATFSTSLADFSASTVTLGNAVGATGTLNVTGGTFNITQSDHAATYEFYVGDQGNGSLNITNGGSLAVAGESRLADSTSTSSATVTVSGAGSTWESQIITSGGPATITVQAGGSLISQDMIVSSGMSLSVSGNGSSLIVTTFFGGSVTLSNGAAAVSDDAAVFGGEINGAGTSWTTSELFESLGNGPTIRNGGEIIAQGTAQIGRRSSLPANPNIDGTLTIDGVGSRITASSVRVGFNQIGNPDPLLARGLLKLLDDGLVSGNVEIRDTGTLSGDGTITGNVTNRGIVQPSLLQVNGSYTQSEDALLRIEIGGTTPGVEYGRLAVAGELELAGTFDVVRIGGFVPQAGDTFDVLDFGSLTIPFPGVDLNLASLPTPLKWDSHRLYTDGLLRAILPGDYNKDGIVDSGDYVVWREQLVSNPSQTLPNDGTLGVGFDDYNTWRVNFGNTAPSGAAAAVPEPLNGLLIGIIAALFSVKARL